MELLSTELVSTADIAGLSNNQVSFETQIDSGKVQCSMFRVEVTLHIGVNCAARDANYTIIISFSNAKGAIWIDNLCMQAIYNPIR